jgi:hypothetical protein
MDWAARISLWIRITLFFLRDFNRHRAATEQIHPLPLCAIRAGSEGAIAALQHLLGLRLVLSLSLALSLSVCEGNKGAKLLRSPQRCCFLPLLIRDWSCGCGSNFGCRVTADRTVLPGGVLLQPLDCLTN